MRHALTAFERASPVDPVAIAAAKDRLWVELQVAGSADELLSAVRSKIGQMGYAPSRVLFELLQNADDAYVQMDAQDGGFRIQLDSSENDTPTVDVVHWGRPINAPGVSAGATGDLRHQNDLYNMLAINHSEKPADSATTGKFGLGFKTVHMVTQNVRLASGFLGASIVGGMIPVEWPRGIEKVRALASGINTATLIELPIDLARQEDINAAVAAFEACAEWLPAIASRIRSIEILRPGNDQIFGTTIEPLVRGSTDGISVILNGGSRSRRALCLDLRDGFSMIVAVGRSGPEAIVASSSIWNLVPLEEQSVTGWLINGPFDVDPGRSHIKGTPEQQADMFAGLGAHLGERLVELFDHIAQEPDAFATRLDMDEGSLGAFWARLATLFLPDLSRERELRLHHAGNGVGRLWRERPSLYTGLPAPFQQLLCARDVRHRTAFALAVPAVFERVAAWPAMAAICGSIVSEQVGDLLLRLAAATPTPLSLTELVRREIGTERRVSVETAELLGAFLTLNALETADLVSERGWLLTELRSCLFLSKAGSWVEVGRLAMETVGDDVEHSRAAFAPDANVLSATYTGPALEFFKVARSTSGFGPTAFILRAWAEQATDPIKRTAFLRYLLRDSSLAAEIAARPVAWLPSPLRDLAHHPLCSGWSSADVTLLLALLQQLPPYVPPPIEPVPPEPYDPADFLSAIHAWWVENRATEIPRYDQRSYPEDFDFTLLSLEDASAWFTMFALAIFQTLGRTQEPQGRSFVESAMRGGWWDELAEFARTEDVAPWVARLEAWSDPEAGDQTFLSWRRCFVDLYAVAKYLPEYIRLIRELPRMIDDEGPIALQSLMRPYQSPIAARMDITAASIDRSLGMGLNWLLRELIRHDVFDNLEKQAVHPYGWTASRRARRLLRQATIELGVPGRMDDSRNEFAEIVNTIGPDLALFEGDLDLPLQLISRLDYRAELVACLEAAGLDSSGLTIDYDDD
ncbi:hypothetical protein QP162_22130 [Sphingomonas aurantiaca]|uniref:hypothetical protein n=1 Tax=Sphingomonas aurantiaca TaxID=185949 RepID=UPI002FDF616C